MILAEYARWLRYFKGRVLLTALVLGVGGCHAIWYALREDPGSAPSSAASLYPRAVVIGGRR